MTFDEIIAAVETELKFARDKFPSNKHLLHAFTEEAGEVTKAFLDNAVGKCESSHIRKELVQAIAMAVRLLQEGGPDFPNLPTMQPPENSVKVVIDRADYEDESQACGDCEEELATDAEESHFRQQLSQLHAMALTTLACVVMLSPVLVFAIWMFKVLFD